MAAAVVPRTRSAATAGHRQSYPNISSKLESNLDDCLCQSKFHLWPRLPQPLNISAFGTEQVLSHPSVPQKKVEQPDQQAVAPNTYGWQLYLTSYGRLTNTAIKLY